MKQRPLLINGFMATGKSTLARHIAEKTGHPYVDLDARLVQRMGMSIPDFFEAHGEEAFRALEREELARILAGWKEEFATAPVCALGGGALIHRPTRLRALRKAVVISLEASLEAILRRARSQGGRPLLSEQTSESAAAKLLEQRRPAYREANALFASDAVSLADLTQQAIEVWELDALVVAAGPRTYLVEVGDGSLDRGLARQLGSPSGVLLVTDQNVHGLYAGRTESTLAAARVNHGTVVLPPGEHAKNLTSMQLIYGAALEHGLDRKGKLLALGGGVVTDMTGFAAATWLRGVGWVGAASTLLAMVDASVGGKTGVDFGPAKNSVGAFWQPSGVVCDTSLIRTENDRAYRGALAEVVKTALIGDPLLLQLLEDELGAVQAREPEILSEIVRRCVALKAWVVATDERETSIRAWLNLGHTLGHALEAEGNYERLTHGEAVSLGLVAALQIGKTLGQTPPALVTRVIELLRRLGLPYDLSGQPLSEAAKLLGHDKKRAGTQIRFVLTQEVGRVSVLPLEVSELQRLTNSMQHPGFGV